MAPYIFAEKNGIHIIDLQKTEAKLDEACAAIKQVAKSGRKILFVATKKQARAIVSEQVRRVGMPYVTERWPGGMLTNFSTIRKAVKKMAGIERLMNDKQFETLSKRERLQISREKEKLEKNLGSIADLNRLPSAIFVVDINKEHIAVSEARRLHIPVFAMVDTNVNPDLVDFVIPANDDASKSIAIIVEQIVNAIEEGLTEHKLDKAQQKEEEEASENEERLAVEGMDEEENEGGSERKRKRNAEEDGQEEGHRERRPRKAPAGAKKVSKR